MNRQVSQEGFPGLGRLERKRMKRRWKRECPGLPLKQWARLGLVGDSAVAWLEHKKAL